MNNEIINKILEYLPMVLGVIVMIIGEGSVKKVIEKVTLRMRKEVEELGEHVKENSKYKELEGQLKMVIQENYDLKVKLNELLTELTKIQHKE